MLNLLPQYRLRQDEWHTRRRRVADNRLDTENTLSIVCAGHPFAIDPPAIEHDDALGKVEQVEFGKRSVDPRFTANDKVRAKVNLFNNDGIDYMVCRRCSRPSAAVRREKAIADPNRCRSIRRKISHVHRNESLSGEEGFRGGV